MPTYNFDCPKCGLFEVFYLKYNPSDIEVCPTCEGAGVRTLKGCIPSISKKGVGWPDKDRKIDDHISYVQRVMKEPVSHSEIKEGNDMLKEREQQKGLPEGYLSGNRPTEEVLVKANDKKAIVDREKLVQQLNTKTGVQARDALNKLDKQIATGEVVKVKKQKGVGKEAIKQRAKHQAQERRKTVI